MPTPEEAVAMVSDRLSLALDEMLDPSERELKKQMEISLLAFFEIKVSVTRVHDEFQCSFVAPSASRYAKLLKALQDLGSCATPDSTATK